MPEERDEIVMETEGGGTLVLSVERYFFYNGEEYAALREGEDRYIMKLQKDGDEETFEPVDGATEDALLKLLDAPQGA